MNEATRHTISQELQQKHPDLSDISNCDPPLLPLLCHDCSGRSFTPCIVLMDHFMPGNSWQAESAAVEREREKHWSDAADIKQSATADNHRQDRVGETQKQITQIQI